MTDRVGVQSIAGANGDTVEVLDRSLVFSTKGMFPGGLLAARSRPFDAAGGRTLGLDARAVGVRGQMTDLYAAGLLQLVPMPGSLTRVVYAATNTDDFQARRSAGASVSEALAGAGAPPDLVARAAANEEKARAAIAAGVWGSDGNALALRALDAGLSAQTAESVRRVRLAAPRLQVGMKLPTIAPVARSLAPRILPTAKATRQGAAASLSGGFPWWLAVGAAAAGAWFVWGGGGR